MNPDTPGPPAAGVSPGASPRHPVRPPATPAEVAAVVAVLAAHSAPGGAAPLRPTPRWRFSGRWWTKPVPARRARP